MVVIGLILEKWNGFHDLVGRICGFHRVDYEMEGGMGTWQFSAIGPRLIHEESFRMDIVIPLFYVRCKTDVFHLCGFRYPEVSL